MISELLLIVSAFFAPAAVSVAAETHAPTSVVVFVDFSASIQGPSRAAYRRELETNILPFLAAGDRIHISGLRVTAQPTTYGQAFHRDWRLERTSGRWEMRDFVLDLRVYPELLSTLNVSASSLPGSGAVFRLRQQVVAHPVEVFR